SAIKLKPNTRSIRVKLIWALLLSVGMAGGCILILCVGMLFASLSRPFAIFFNRHVFLFLLFFLLIFSSLFIVFFLALIKKGIGYLDEITHRLDTIGAGNLAIQIPVKTSDELGRMAETVNDMAAKLKASLEEERRLEQSKNDLITNISHDLRTPLTSILGYLELINRLEDSDAEKLRKYSRIAYDQCWDLKLRIDDLFEFSKLHNSGIKINLTRVNLGELLEQVVLGFMPALQEAGLEYRLAFPREKLFAEVDLLLIKRLFDNLISNAIKYGSGGKCIDVEVARGNDQVVIRIMNEGKMIPENELPYVFERFYRVADEGEIVRGESRGSGLGLAIAKSIVELHQGTIGVSSVEGRTVFEVRLPLSIISLSNIT
ncbi:MAG TPA: HAMP domain-containing sensor histidine kinase, partial [Bacillota bacterium]|nr:HAMP domain-containing sensor histidine kinase [Bacillota bacterium]